MQEARLSLALAVLVMLCHAHGLGYGLSEDPVLLSREFSSAVCGMHFVGRAWYVRLGIL